MEEISKDEMNITYTSKQIYKFDRKQSYPLKENDKIVVLNVAMNVSVIFIRNSMDKRFLVSIINIFKRFWHKNSFMYYSLRRRS